MGHRTGLWASLALAAVAAAVTSAAPSSPSPPSPPSIPTHAVDASGADDVVYDQRQNGTENVRISLSDLRVVLAPADGLFQIMSMAGAQFLNSEMGQAAGSEQRPSAGECTGFKCNNRHRQAAKKNRFKLSSLIAPLFNNQVEQKTVETESSNNNNSINSNN